MNELEKEIRYLSLYRQKLQRDLDAMGYGQSQNYVPNQRANIAEKPRLSFANLAVALAAMGLLGAHG